MKIDSVFIKEYLKLIAGIAISTGGTWTACWLASQWGLTGITCLVVLAFLVAAVFMANLSAKEKRFSRRIKP